MQRNLCQGKGGACHGCDGREVCPQGDAAAVGLEGDGSFKGYGGSKEAENHEDAVQAGKIHGGDGGFEAQTQQGGVEPAQ